MMRRTAEDLTMETRQCVAPYEMVLRRLGLREGTQNDSLMRIGVSSWLLDLDANKYDANRMAIAFEKDGSVTITAGDKAGAGPSDYSWHYRSVTPARLSSHINSSLWEIERRQVAAMDATIARELAKIAGELLGVTRIAAVKDLAEIKAIIPETRKAQEEHNKKMEEFRQVTNQMWSDATRELQTKTGELLTDIRDDLVGYFKSAGKGVRYVGGPASGSSLVEVFLGSDDGVKRYQSKVSAFIALTFEGRERATFMLRPENADNTIELTLSDKNTVAKLMQAVKNADKKGFWDMAEME
jgi:hypothetical protein